MKRSGGGGDMDLDVWMQMPKHFGIEKTMEVTKEVEDFLEAHREEYGIRTLRTRTYKRESNVELYLEQDPNQDWWYHAYKNLRKSIGMPVDLRMDMQAVAEELDKNSPGLLV